MNAKSSKLLAAASKHLTTDPVEWLRPSQAVIYSGLSRATLYNLMGEGAIKSACIRRQGCVKGVRVISRESLEEYISSFVEKGGAA